MAKLDSQRTYRVTGPLTVCGARPGTTFTAALPVGQEAFLLAVGHIAVEPKKGTDGRKPPAGTTGEDQKEKA